MEKNMKCVISETGVVSYNEKTILDEQTKFCKELYAKDETIAFPLKPDSSEWVLSDVECKLCDQPFLVDKFFYAMMTIKSNKVPGLDGITIEFYRKF